MELTNAIMGANGNIAKLAIAISEKEYQKQNKIVNKYLDYIENGVIDMNTCDTWVDIWGACAVFAKG